MKCTAAVATGINDYLEWNYLNLLNMTATVISFVGCWIIYDWRYHANKIMIALPRCSNKIHKNDEEIGRYLPLSCACLDNSTLDSNVCV